MVGIKNDDVSAVEWIKPRTIASIVKPKVSFVLMRPDDPYIIVTGKVSLVTHCLES